MDIGDAIFSLLAVDPGVLATIDGTDAAPYIFPDTAPRGVGAHAYIVLKLISDLEESSLTGDSGLGHSRITVECIAATYVGARAIRDAVVPVLQAYRGTPPNGGGLFIQSILIDSQHRFTTTSIDDETLSSFGRSIDFITWHAGPA